MYRGYNMHGISKTMEKPRKALKKCLKDGPSAVEEITEPS
jgi:hypothetical protein